MPTPQEIFNTRVLAAVQKHTDVMLVAAQLRRQGDPGAKRIEESQMMMQSVIKSLQDYDISSDYFTNDQIEYLFELLTGAGATVP